MGGFAAQHPLVGVDRGPAVGEDAADAGVAQCGDGGVGVGGAVLDVGLVAQGGDAGVERAERADEVADVDVLGGELRAPGELDVLAVVREVPADADLADRALPGVAVGVDESGQHGAVGAVDDGGALGVECRRRPRAMLAVVDQDVADEVAESRRPG